MTMNLSKSRMNITLRNYQEEAIDFLNTNEEFPYWSEEETMNFLNYNETSIRNLRNSKALTRYQIGQQFFYDKKEIAKLIEDSKIYQQNVSEYHKYIDETNKTISNKELNTFERQFISINAKRFLDYIYQILPEKNQLRDRDKYILETCLSKNSFVDLARELNLSSTRIAYLFKQSLNTTINVCLKMKKNYDENYIPLKKENELLKEQNHQLKSELFKLNKDSQFFNNYVDKDLVLLTRVSDLDISSRLLSVFRYKGIETLGDIVGYSKRDFFYCRNFGNKSLLELETLIEKYGLKLNK